MKKQLVLMAFAAVISITSVNAQNFQRRTVEERVKSIHEKMDSAFKPEASKLVQIDSIFANYYRTTDKSREEMTAAGADRDAMRAKMQEFATERDNKLKAILTEDQMKQWKEVIEPSMRRPRGGGGGGNN